MGLLRRAFPRAVRRAAVLVGLLLLVLAGDDPRTAAATVPPGFDDQHVATLARPTALAFTPDGRMLIAAKDATVHVMRPGSAPQLAMAIHNQTCFDGERGVLGIAVDPLFQQNHFVYVYYTFKKFGVCDTSGPNVPVNRVSRFVLSGSDVIDPAAETVLVDNIPSPNGMHNAGDLGFGPDGYLYASVGDGGCDFRGDSGCGLLNDASRDLSGLSGKVLRVTRDGDTPPGNPFAGSQSSPCRTTGMTNPHRRCSEIYLTGLRNPFRFAFDPQDGRLYVNDVGEAKWEEIDRGAPGADYGWNVREGPCARDSRTNCGPPPSGMTNPIHSYDHLTGCTSITAGAFVPAGAWPAAHDGKYVYGDLVCGKLFELAGEGATASAQEFGTDLGFLIDATFGPHGTGQALYYITWGEWPNDSIRRIAHVGVGNRAPEAVAEAAPRAGDVPLTVEFSGESSSDPDGDPLTYRWDFGDGSAPSTAARVSHTYTSDGTYTATLEVTDGRGGRDTASVAIVAGNEPPAPTISSPEPGRSFAVGEPITLTGSASDPEEGVLPDEALTWEVIRHHDTHTHPFFPRTSGNSLQFEGPPPEDITATATSHLEVILTATDSTGLSTTVSRDVVPRTVELTFATEPSGLTLDVAGSPVTGPSTVTSWEGWRIPVDAPDQTDTGGRGVTFVSWSDDGARTHEIATPSAPAAYTARFTHSYVRPLSASPTRFPLVIAYSPCDAPGAVHGPPLDHPSCVPPQQSSSRLTVGTTDANGASAAMAGRVRLAARVGDPMTVADEADVALVVALSDVRRAATLVDYPGELELVLGIRISDKLNGPAAEPGTMEDRTLRATVPCAVTVAGSVGSTCSLTTTLETLIPGATTEGARAIWAIDRVTLNDGGPDEDAGTQDNAPFAVPGIFIP